MKMFYNKVVIVTGAGSGIGQASAMAFAKEGAKVIVSDITEKNGIETVEMINKSKGESFFIRCNVSSEIDVKNLIDSTLKQYGRLDCAYNNAGTEGEISKITDSTIDNWDQTINVDLKGVWLCMKFQILAMLRNGAIGGSIVNCASIAGMVGFEGSSAYVAAKHGVIGLTKTAALEYAKNNIRINSVSPGLIHTPMLKRVLADHENEMAQQVPLGRVGRAEEIADSVLWLCSEKSSYVTGENLTVDGGWTTR